MCILPPKPRESVLTRRTLPEPVAVCTAEVVPIRAYMFRTVVDSFRASSHRAVPGGAGREPTIRPSVVIPCRMGYGPAHSVSRAAEQRRCEVHVQVEMLRCEVGLCVPVDLCPFAYRRRIARIYAACYMNIVQCVGHNAAHEDQTQVGFRMRLCAPRGTQALSEALSIGKEGFLRSQTRVTKGVAVITWTRL